MLERTRCGYRPGYAGGSFFQAAAGIRAGHVTGVQTCALPIFMTSNIRSIEQMRDLVDPVQELRPEVVAHLLDAPDVGRHDEDGVAEVHRTALTRSEERRVGKEWT